MSWKREEKCAPSWTLAWDSCILTRMTIQVPYFAIFFEDKRKRESVENSPAPNREGSARWSQELFWILQVLLHILYPASPRSHPDLALLSVSLLHSANGPDSSSSCLSCFCGTQQMVPPSSSFTGAVSSRRHFKFVSTTAHVLGSSRIPSFHHYKGFSPQALDIVTENMYTLIFPYFRHVI